MRAVVFTGAGGPEVVRLDERPAPQPTGDEVVVAVRYAGLNPADLAQRAGRYPAPPGVPADIPGIEVAGAIVALGPLALGHRVGDRVFGIVGGGGLAQRVVVPARHVTAVPGTLDDVQAAAVPEVFVTAHDAVVTQAGLRLGEVLLVNGANGGVGTAAVQIGVAAGARVVATVRSPERRAEVAALGATVVDPAEVVATTRALGGADVVLELVGAPTLGPSLDCIAARGRVVVVGTGAGAEISFDLRKVMARRISLRGTVLRSRPHEEKATAIQAFAREVVPGLASGALRPLVDSVFPWNEAGGAFDRLEGTGKLGKVLLDFGEPGHGS
jgi:putative PIG3 family NAD(P)H quinone oxidoreductase